VSDETASALVVCGGLCECLPVDLVGLDADRVVGAVSNVTPMTRLKTDSDWLKSLQIAARAQAILWSQTPIGIRQTILARAEQEYRETQEGQ
jgi:hypothetical protein